MQTKQQGATQAQLAHRALWLKLALYKKVEHLSRTLDTAHLYGWPFAATQVGNDLLDVMAEAGL